MRITLYNVLTQDRPINKWRLSLQRKATNPEVILRPLTQSCFRLHTLLRQTPVAAAAQNDKTIPQAATSFLDVCLEAIQQGDLAKPIDQWLAQKKLGPSAQRQVVAILLFLDLLDDSRHLIPEMRAWRCDRKSASEALVLRIRRGYLSAGCARSQAELIGNAHLTKEALGRLLDKEPPFQRLKNSGTRGNAVRFACHVHEAIVADKLTPQPHIQQDSAPPDKQSPPSGHGGTSGLTSSRLQFPAGFKDQGTIFNPKQYRIARLRDDLWVYGKVQFETPGGEGGLAWGNKPDSQEYARWLEQLAAALLQEADALQRGKPGLA
jgi:hypothetical protein